jgi:RHS repeat-associated protein
MPYCLGYRGELTINGTIHLRARDYDARTGTFTKRDEIDGDDGTTTVANGFHYTSNNPIDLEDPSGLSPRPTGDGTFNDAAIGAAGDEFDGKIVQYGSTGNRACLEPPMGRQEGWSCSLRPGRMAHSSFGTTVDAPCPMSISSAPMATGSLG